MKIQTLLVALLILVAAKNNAQNLHFTYLDFVPQSYNPALNGGFSGSYRASILYRSQYNNPGITGYRTMEINIDAPIIRGIRKQDWVGVGISFDNDKMGSTRYKTNTSRLGLAYHLGLDKKQTRIFAVGIQYVNKGINVEKGSYNTNLRGTADPMIDDLFKQSGTAGGNPTSGLTSNNWVLGTTFTQINKTNRLMLGASVSGIISGQAAAEERLIKEPFTLMGIMQFKTMVNKKILIEPTVFIQSIPSEATEFVVNSTIGYKLSKDSDWIFKAGLGFRTGTPSVQFLAGAEKGSLKVGLSYDAPLGGFAAAIGLQNAFELGASYIGVFNKTPKPKPTIICPRL